ncbi:THAP domain-containing protein 1-like, partial [Lepeophtheirus salmonis]|uniref:THAP domain-containing protein 1-like n=1 Tax=Lepeophtheirus salmonis TaxID=72036 RepID=UPI001AE8975E
MSCVSFGCKNKYAKGNSISYHRFTIQDTERCRQWVRNFKRDDFTPKSFAKICSEHFTPESFNRTLDVFQEEVERTCRKRKSPSKRSSSSPKKGKPSPGLNTDLSLYAAKENVQLDHPYSLPSAQLIKE